MLDLTTGGDGEEVYKVIVLDRPCRDIVSPLIRVNDLRKHGVTLHLLIETERCAKSDSEAPPTYKEQNNLGVHVCAQRRCTTSASHSLPCRQRIEDVPALYFLSPTEANVKRIADDLAAGLYDSAHLNFSSSLPRWVTAHARSLSVVVTLCVSFRMYGEEERDDAYDL